MFDAACYEHQAQCNSGYNIYTTFCWQNKPNMPNHYGIFTMVLVHYIIMVLFDGQLSVMIFSKKSFVFVMTKSIYLTLCCL